MAALAAPHEGGGATTGLKAYLAVALLALLAGALGAVLLNGHAVQRHGCEAQQILDEASRREPDGIFQNDDDPSVWIWLYRLVVGNQEKWGICIVQEWPSLTQRCDYRLRTAFIPRDGARERVLDYLCQFASPVE